MLTVTPFLLITDIIVAKMDEDNYDFVFKSESNHTMYNIT